jgi:hypothetical protein
MKHTVKLDENTQRHVRTNLIVNSFVLLLREIGPDQGSHVKYAVHLVLLEMHLCERSMQMKINIQIRMR